MLEYIDDFHQGTLTDVAVTESGALQLYGGLLEQEFEIVLPGRSLIDTGSSNYYMPFNTNYYDNRYQYIISSAILANAGVPSGATIKAMKLHCGAYAPGRDLVNVRIRMANTTVNASSTWYTDTFTVVYGPKTIAYTAIQPQQWYRFDFDTPFVLGNNNLMVDISRDGAAAAAGGGNYAYSVLLNEEVACGMYGNNVASWPYNSRTPTTLDVFLQTILVVEGTGYKLTGTRISPIIDISSIGVASSGFISWNATIPEGTSIKIEVNVSFDNGVTWQGWTEVQNSSELSILTGADVSNGRLQIRQTLSTTNANVTPVLNSLSVNIYSLYTENIITYSQSIGTNVSRHINKFIDNINYVKQTMAEQHRSISVGRSTKNYTSKIVAAFSGNKMYMITAQFYVKQLTAEVQRKQILLGRKTSSDITLDVSFLAYRPVIEWVPLGIFWSNDWSVPDSDVYVQVVGRDRLELLQKSTYNTSAVQQNTTLYDLAVTVLQDAGLKPDEEYWVDPELQNYTIPYAYFEPQSHREALRKIAEACLGEVYCDRNGIVRVEGPSFLTSNVAIMSTITPDDYFEKDNPVKWSEIANYIEVETQPLQPDVAQEVYRTNESISISAGETKKITITYNQSPCIEAEALVEDALSSVTIQAATYYAWGADITVYSTENTSFNLIVNAKPLKVLNKERIIAQDMASITDNGIIKYTFPANPLVQSRTIAQLIADNLLAMFKEPRKDIEVVWRGNFALLLGDKVRIVDQHGYEDYCIIRQNIEYDGTLSAQLSGRRIE